MLQIRSTSGKSRIYQAIDWIFCTFRSVVSVDRPVTMDAYTNHARGIQLTTVLPASHGVRPTYLGDTVAKGTKFSSIRTVCQFFSPIAGSSGDRDQGKVNC